MSDRSLHLEASLDKELYYHGEPISVNVHVTNNSSKSVKKVKVSVRQYADICLFSTAQYKCPVAQVGQEDQVAPSSTFCKVYTLTPLLSANREKRGLALDGKLKHEDTNLASSTMDPMGRIEWSGGLDLAPDHIFPTPALDPLHNQWHRCCTWLLAPPQNQLHQEAVLYLFPEPAASGTCDTYLSQLHSFYTWLPAPPQNQLHWGAVSYPSAVPT
ncbi:beta-arrestin-2 isoform X2 [Alligator sinensis]|uniref:Beta-arrestin-2 isoform X2 n=1 Tax=Alligator sinensis TaxID=38654 RepID=A0A3Q0H4B5_ALLSI|nr:beta-arrestin-2 isoform X2 [Alligator sinensis]